MLSAEDNERLTRVGPGTPMGALLRRYWMPIAAAAELDERPVRPGRLLGEDLVLYRDRARQYGLVARRCPHRGADLAYGITDAQGLRCSYHGWCFDGRGRCVEQPFEEVAHPEARFRERVSIAAYRVAEHAGLVWAYLGPEPAPCLVDWARFSEPGQPVVTFTPLPCNWLQCFENSIDPLHFEWLHQNLSNDRNGPRARPGERGPTHKKVAFEEFEHGFIYRRVLANTDESHPLWTVGRVSLWPNALYTGGFIWHVPMDDTHTLEVTWMLTSARLGRSQRVPYRRGELQRDRDGLILPIDVLHQDALAMVGQGPIADRTREQLGESDRGVILLRKRLLTELEAVAAGRDPKGLVRDSRAARNVPLPLAPPTPELRPRPPRETGTRALVSRLRNLDQRVRGVAERLVPLATRGLDDLAKRARLRPRRAHDDLGAQLSGYRMATLLYLVAKLGLADRLAAGPRTADALAREIGAHAPSLARLLRALATQGLFTEDGGRFALAARGQRLRSGVPGSLRDRALLVGDEYMPAWLGLVHSMVHGGSAFERVFGMSNWAHRQASPDLDRAFNEWLAQGVAWCADRLCDSGLVNGARVIVDIGGGLGTLLERVLERTPGARGVLFEQPHVIAGASLGPRVEAAGGDFFAAVPSGGDLYLLKNVLHNWDDAQARTLLETCRRALSPGARLLVIESLLPEGPSSDPAVFFADLHMLALDGGRERTATEYRALFSAAALRLQRTIELGPGTVVMELVAT